VRFAAAVSLIILAGMLPAAADPEPDYLPGPWHYHAITCVDTTVVSASPAVAAPGKATIAPNATNLVTFDTGLGIVPLFPSGKASVIRYVGDAGSDIMSAERAGDRVQVCYLGGPAPTQSCNPDKDERGRSYRVYDYRQQKQYWGYNALHLCGGA
jgi:hypothetical protein